MRRTKWAEKSLLGALGGYAIDVSEAFRIVSLETVCKIGLGRTMTYASEHGKELPN
jgi:hypothetical protein